MNGVTGRMGTNQHLLRSIVPIIEQGGVQVGEDERLVPDPVLVGRNMDKLNALGKKTGIEKITTDVGEALADPYNEIYFDAQTTQRRVAAVSDAIKAGKHIYCEKPTALTTTEALALHTAAENAGIIHGVVQDKLWLPGMLKFRQLRDDGFFGKILSVRGEFGYWVFEGDKVPAQRPSWNYRAEDGGGIIFDMFCHWRYVVDNLFGNIKSVSALGATHIPKRWDENGEPYDCTADDAAYATFELADGTVAQFNSSWCVRVRRDDLLVLQVDGTKGSAVVTLRKCFVQSYENTPKPVWNPDVDSPIDFFEDWEEVGAGEEFENAFKLQWEMYLKAIAAKNAFKWNLLEGAKGVQLAEKGLESWRERKWVKLGALA
jgi:predicted dehydrogenase